MKFKLKSNVVVIAIFILIFLLIGQVALYSDFVDTLKTGTKTIGDLSRIRGDIQRYTKLYLASEVNPYFRDRITSRIDYYASDKKIDEIMEFQNHYNIKELQTQWAELLDLLDEYGRNPSLENRIKAVNKSEYCWRIADSFILRTEYISSKTAANLRYFNTAIVLNLVIFIVLLLIYKKFIHNALKTSSHRDYLTGIFNRRYFYEFLDYELLRSQRKKTTFSIIIFDIDFFKKVNDEHGHLYGDIVLKALTQLVQSSIRKTDVLARLGGEEFVILLPDTSPDNAYLISEKLRQLVADYIFPENRHITISLGVTGYQKDDFSHTIVLRADDALYRAKNNGRNRSEV